MMHWLVVLFLALPAFATPECENELTPVAALIRVTNVALKNGILQPRDLERLINGEITDIKSLGKPLTSENLFHLQSLVRNYLLLKGGPHWRRARQQLESLSQSAKNEAIKRDEARQNTALILSPKAYARLELDGARFRDSEQVSYAASSELKIAAYSGIDDHNRIHIQNSAGETWGIEDFGRSKQLNAQIEIMPDGRWRLHILSGQRVVKYWTVDQDQQPVLVSRLELVRPDSLLYVDRWIRADRRHILVTDLNGESAGNRWAARAFSADGQRSKKPCLVKSPDGLVFVAGEWYCIDTQAALYRLDGVEWVEVFAGPPKSVLWLADHGGKPWVALVDRDRIRVRPLSGSTPTFKIEVAKGFNIFTHMGGLASNGESLFILYYQGERRYRLVNLHKDKSELLAAEGLADNVRPSWVSGPEGQPLLFVGEYKGVEFVSADNRSLGRFSRDSSAQKMLGEGENLTLVTRRGPFFGTFTLEFSKIFAEAGR